MSRLPKCVPPAMSERYALPDRVSGVAYAGMVVSLLRVRRTQRRMIRRVARVATGLITASILAACDESSERKEGIAAQRPAPTAQIPTPRRAWYLSARFAATDSQIAGVRLSAIDTSWAAASVLTHEILPPEAATNRYDPIRSSAPFSRVGDFDGDGVQDKAVVGVYRTHDGEAGRFLAIFSDVSGDPHLTGLFTFAGPVFSHVSGTAEGLRWASCMSCDSWLDITWNGEKYTAKSFVCC